MAEVINSEGKSINQELLIQGLAKPWDGTGPAPV
jgi:endonuclease YncB( thermonuclease family)